jgi:hypothetical protein
MKWKNFNIDNLRCKSGYYGAPELGIRCKKCSCPGTTKNNNFELSCSLDFQTGKQICNCMTGYAGEHCEKCQNSYFGDPLEIGGSCKLCNCNNNIDANEQGNCDSKTGFSFKIILIFNLNYLKIRNFFIFQANVLNVYLKPKVLIVKNVRKDFMEMLSNINAQVCL